MWFLNQLQDTALRIESRIATAKVRAEQAG
jgi:hypothetical protein